MGKKSNQFVRSSLLKIFSGNSQTCWPPAPSDASWPSQIREFLQRAQSPGCVEYSVALLTLADQQHNTTNAWFHSDGSGFLSVYWPSGPHEHGCVTVCVCMCASSRVNDLMIVSVTHFYFFEWALVHFIWIDLIYLFCCWSSSVALTWVKVCGSTKINLLPEGLLCWM